MKHQSHDQPPLEDGPAATLSVAAAIERARRAPTIDTRTACVILGVSDDTAYSAARKGEFGAFRIAGRYRFLSKPVLAAIGETLDSPVAA